MWHTSTTRTSSFRAGADGDAVDARRYINLTEGVRRLPRRTPRRAYDVSEALDEYHEYHEKGRLASKPLLWLRAGKVSPADW